MMLQACVDDILIRGLDDWVQAAEVASVSRTTGGAQSDEATRELSLRLIGKLLEEGLVEIGMVDAKKGFIPWDVPVDDAMQRIRDDWSSDSMGPGLGEVCWLNITEKGRAQAQALCSK